MSLQLAVLQLRPHFPAVRHLLPSWLGAVLLAGFTVSELSRRTSGRVLGWAAVLLVVVFDAGTLRDYYDHGRPRWNEVAMSLSASVRDGERLIAANGWVLRNLGYYWSERGLGRPGIPLERAGTELEGPSWIVTAVCPLDPDVEVQLRGLPVRRAFPMTNHCEIRFLPRGQRLHLPHGFCSKDV